MRIAYLPVLFLSAACCLHACGVYPQFEANRTVEFTLPADQLQRVQCTSHNGRIEITGADVTTVAVRVVLTARGHTAQEAEENLRFLDVAKTTKEGVLSLSGTKAPEAPSHLSPGFAFTLTVPKALAVSLTTHNGRVEAKDLTGEFGAITHNGRIQADVASKLLNLETHNGAIEVTSRASGTVDGQLVTHNGSVTLALAEGASTTVSARTHNGSVSNDGAAQNTKNSRSNGVARYGAGDGKLSVTTHNGGVRLR
jgi:DUF4097 and DUF4098 domain-containing protein YvlB